MGNQNLQYLQFSDDLLYQQFQKLYRRYTVYNAKPQHQLQSTQINLQYQIIMHNEIYSEIEEKHYHTNIKYKEQYVDFDMLRFTEQLVLLDLQISINDKNLNISFIRLFDIKHNRNIIDIADPKVGIPLKIQPNDRVIISYRYFMPNQVNQNNVYTLQLPLSMDSPYNISIIKKFKHELWLSPTHKMIQNQENFYEIKHNKGYDIGTFLLIFSVPNKEQLRIYGHKVLYGTQSHSQQEKYCLMATFLPPSINNFDDMIYFNFDDPDMNLEQDTLETNSRVTSLGTIRPETFTYDYIYSILPIVTSKKQITFFIDQSNSMQEQKMDLAISALQVFVKSLPIDVLFNIYSFGSTYKKMFEKYQIISEPVVNRCKNLIAELKPDMGSTFLLEALKDALSCKDDGYEQIWFVLTDGRLSNSKEILQLIKDNNFLRVYTLGLGMEFDKYMIEQMALFGNGNFTFCLNLYTMNGSAIEMLQQALAPRLRDFQFKISNSRLTTLVPNPSKYYFIQNTSVTFNLFIDQSQKDLNDGFITIQVEYNYEGQMIKTEHSFNLNSCSKDPQLHVYTFSKLLKGILQFMPLGISLYQNALHQKIGFYDLIKSQSRYPFFSPLMGIDLGSYVLVQNINIDLLKQISKENESQDLITMIKELVPKQELSYLQIISGLPQHVADLQDGKQTQFFNVSSFTKANQQCLIDVIYLQQLDGSFNEEGTLHMICPVRNPHESALHQIPESLPTLIVDGMQNQQIPKFLISQIWITALAIAYLKQNFRQQRGQWLLVFVKGLSFIKQYVKNWQQLLYKAGIVLQRANKK